MDLKNYLVILKGNLIVILVTVFITMAVVIGVTFSIAPTYTASTTLRVATASSGVLGYSDYVYAERLMNTYTKLATSRPVLDELAAALNLPKAPVVKVELIANTELMRISVDSTDPVVAQRAANKLGEILIVKGKELYTGEGKSPQEILGEQLAQADEELSQARQEYDQYLKATPVDSEKVAAMEMAIELKQRTYTTLLDQYDDARLKETIRANIISVVEPAIIPTEPTQPQKALNIILGFIIGLTGGVGLAFLFENLGARMYTSGQIEKVTELNLIGKIPLMEQKGKWFYLWKRNDAKKDFPYKEAFNRLHIHLMAQAPGGSSYKSLLITSSEPGEGKSTITAQLAKTIALSGEKVIVVDCDMRIPTQHKIHGLSNQVGLSSVLCQDADLASAIQKSRYPGMDVITSGPQPANPINVLGSPHMKALIQELSNEYDIVLIDAPAILAVADTAHLVSIVDGVILVVRRNQIREDTVRETCKLLEDIKAPTIGLVVNGAERNGTYYYSR